MSTPKRIILDATKEDLILQVRAAQSAIKAGHPAGSFIGIVFEDGSAFGVHWNKDSVRVYPQERSK